jgi:hypothetical protein
MQNFLTQLIITPTRNDNILDLVLSTNPDIIYDLETHPGMSDHNAITYQVNLSKSESIYQRTDNTMAKRKSTKGQTTIQNIHIKLKIE